MSSNSLNPIHEKIKAWLFYLENKPQSDSDYIEFRKKHDLDCILTGGNLHSDTIFSLFTPLRRTLVSLNGYGKLSKLGNVEKSIEFLKNLQNSLDEYLPENDALVQKLIELFEVGMTRANVMILPEIGINRKRGIKPYFDYVPYFIVECFEGGDFSGFFESDEKLENWIKDENLVSLFDGVISKENVRDLACTGNVRENKGTNREQLLKTFDNYIGVIKSRM